MSQYEENLNSNDIQKILPQKYPYLLVDKIISIQQRKFIVGIKNVSINEPYFQGHFPNFYVMPTSMILEAMSQTGSVLLLRDPEFTGRYTYFNSLNDIEFFKAVEPGDQLRCEMEISNIDDNNVSMTGFAFVDGEIVCKGKFNFTLAMQPSKLQIDSTATVHHTATLGHNVQVGANTIVGEHVHIGDNTTVEANCFIEKWTKIGEDCHIHFGCVIGSAAQDAKYKGEKSWVVIGDRNEIREYVTINRATGKNEVTEIGSDNTFLTHVHIAHNCKLGNHITIANMTNVAGHTEIEDNVVIGGMTGIHQFTKIGKGAMVGAYTRLAQDVPPFMLCEGNPAIVRGLNVVGLKRRGASRAVLAEIKDIYKLLFKSDLNTSSAITQMKESNYSTEEAQKVLHFLQADSHRGFTKKSEKKISLKM
jgi:UDP-N-acetylglucosamine acyltransferase